MKIVVALDKFKGSLSASRACAIVRDAILSVHPGAQVIVKPMADGGDGTATVIHEALSGEWIQRQVTGPLSDKVEAKYLWLSDQQLAVIEMATASGLVLLKPSQRDPLRTTSYGTGELIRDALARGAQKILLGVGGSATVDGGVGAVMALGWKFLDTQEKSVSFGGSELSRIVRIVPPQQPVASSLEVLCDVDNPLCGEHGAAHVFGPQKGATPAMVDQLDEGLRHLARLIEEQLGKDVINLPGTGAAGGLPAGAVAFMNARLVSGIDTVMTVTKLYEALRGADWVITGEGRFDEQSLRGKVVDGVMRLAKRNGTKVAVLAGSVRIATPAGIEIALATKPDSLPLDQALTRAEELLAERARELASKL